MSRIFECRCEKCDAEIEGKSYITRIEYLKAIEVLFGYNRRVKREATYILCPACAELLKVWVGAAEVGDE